MIEFLLRRFAPGYENPKDESVRRRVGMLAGAMGIAHNLVLFSLKLAIAVMSGSVAILSDAFNNISDMGSSLVTLLGMRMAGRRPDREHPFGHGRFEYISALIVAMMILLVGFELIKTSFAKLLAPEPVVINAPMLFALGLSILVKLWMFYYNRSFGRRIGSGVLAAAAADSLNDVIVTSVIVVSAYLSSRFGWNIDAPAGILVSLFILYSGIQIARDVVSQLLGGKPDPELARNISQRVLAGDGIVGVHDLIVHDYGPGRLMASVHAEVPDDANILRMHESIDAIERRIQEELGVPVVIHMDPISVNCERTNEVRAQLVDILTKINPRFTMHDFRMVDGDSRINLIFDLVVPGEMSDEERKAALVEIGRAAAELDARYRMVVQVDNQYAP